MSEELTAKSEIHNPEANLPNSTLENKNQEKSGVEASDTHRKDDDNFAGVEESSANNPNAIINRSDVNDGDQGANEVQEIQTVHDANDVEEINSEFQHQNTPSGYPVLSPDLPSTESLIPGSIPDENNFSTDIPGSVVETNLPLKPDSGISSTEGNLSYEDNYIIINRMTDDTRNIENSCQLNQAKHFEELRNSEPGSRADILSIATTTSSGNVKMRQTNSKSQPISISSSNGIHHTSLRATPLSVKITEVDEQSGIVYGTLTDEHMFRHQQSNPDNIVLADSQIAKPYYYNDQLQPRQHYNGQVLQPYKQHLYQQPVTAINKIQLGIKPNDVGLARTIYPELPYIEDFNNIGPGPTYVRCPKCNMKTLTRVDRKPSSCAFISGFILCLCLACFVPFCMRRCQAVDHYCIRCQTFLGRYSRC